MAAANADRLLQSLEAGSLGGVFFLYGEETLLKERAADRIINAHIDAGTRDFNLDQLRGGDLEAETLASILATPPMMAEWRVVVVREAEALAGSARTRGIIEEQLDRTAPGLALVLVADIPSGSRAKFYDRLRRDARSAEFGATDPSDVPAWLLTQAEASGIELDPRAARALAASIGTELGVLAQELDKLRDYVGDRGRIELADVEAVVGRVARHNRWDWMDQVGGGEFAKARAALPDLLDAGESGVGLVLGLGTHFLRLAIYATGGERALAEALPARFRRWLPRRLGGQARRWPPAALEAALDDLLRADRLLKSTSLDDEQVIDELLLRLQMRMRSPVPA